MGTLSNRKDPDEMPQSNHVQFLAYLTIIIHKTTNKIHLTQVNNSSFIRQIHQVKLFCLILKSINLGLLSNTLEMMFFVKSSLNLHNHGYI